MGLPTLLHNEVIYLAEEKFRNKGIDTPYEREKIEYRPDIRYEKDYVPPSDSYQFPDDLSQQKQLYIADFVKQKNVSEKRLVNLKSLIEQRMKGDIIRVNYDEYPEAQDFDMSTITFEEYQKSLNKTMKLKQEVAPYEDHLRVKIYEDYHSTNIKGRVEVELYRDALEFIDDIAIFNGFVQHIAIDPLGLSELTDEEIRAAEDAKFAKWEEADRKVAATESRIRQKLGLNPGQNIDFESLTKDQWDLIQEDYEELRLAKSDLRRYKTDPVNKVKRIVEKKISSWLDFANQAESVLLRTVYDILQGGIECLILKSINAKEIGIRMDKKEFEDLYRKLEESYNVLGAVEKMLMLSILDEDELQRAITAKILHLVREPVKSIVNEILSTIVDLRNNATRSVQEWLHDVSEEDTAECWPFEQLAELMVDSIYSVENKTKYYIMELYKIILSGDGLSDQKLNILRKKQFIRSNYQVISVCREIIRKILDMLDKFTYQDIVRVIDETIEEQDWHHTYDEETGQVKPTKRQKLVDLL